MTHWSDRAACRGMTEVMVVPRGHPGRFPSKEQRRRVARAQAICATCPVLEQCATYADHLAALGHPITEMVIAGRDPRSLDHLRRQHA